MTEVVMTTTTVVLAMTVRWEVAMMALVMTTMVMNRGRGAEGHDRRR